jgi:predicted nucleotidyltransferase
MVILGEHAGKQEQVTPEVISIVEAKRRFGTSTPNRQFLFERFERVFNLLHETVTVKHVYLFGSFPAAIPSPNDVDLFVVMAADFTTRDLREDLVDVFTHHVCRMRYNVDVFWVTEAIGEEQINVALDVFSRNRAHEPQALLEVVR